MFTSRPNDSWMRLFSRAVSVALVAIIALAQVQAAEPPNPERRFRVPPPPPPQAVPSIAPRPSPLAPVQPPPYPQASQEAKEEGIVTLELWVLRDGQVQESRVKRSSGSPRLDEAAREHALHWRLLPGREAGVPVNMWTVLVVTFIWSPDGKSHAVVETELEHREERII